MVETASNSVNVLLHRLNNTHLLTYCSAQLTRTLNCKHRLLFSILASALAYALCATCSYSWERMFPGTFATWNKSSRELSLPVPGNFHSRERKFPVGTFAPRSKNTGERKVPEPLIWCTITKSGMVSRHMIQSVQRMGPIHASGTTACSVSVIVLILHCRISPYLSTTIWFCVEMVAHIITLLPHPVNPSYLSFLSGEHHGKVPTRVTNTGRVLILTNICHGHSWKQC